MLCYGVKLVNIHKELTTEIVMSNRGTVYHDMSILHSLFVTIKEDLKDGDSLEFIISFEGKGSISVSVNGDTPISLGTSRLLTAASLNNAANKNQVVVYGLVYGSSIEAGSHIMSQFKFTCY